MTHYKSFLHALHGIYYKGEKKGTKAGRQKLGDFVSINFVQELIYSLEQVSLGTEQLLYFVGKKYGKDVAAEYIKGRDKKKILKQIGSHFEKNKVGLLEIVNVEKKRVVVRIKECAISHNAPGVSTPVCFFISGFLAGVIEKKLKKSCIVNETMCCALGDDFCEFIIREQD